MALTNSAIVLRREVTVCRDGHLDDRQLDLTGLEDKLHFLSTLPADGRINAATLSFPSYQTPQNAEFQPLFATYPLAHPDILHDLLLHVGTVIFPAHDFDLFLHFKGHGSAALVLTGPDPATIVAKTERQRQAWAAAMAERGSTLTLPELTLGQAGRSKTPPAPIDVLDEIGLGRAAGLPDDAGPGARLLPLVQGLGINFLGEEERTPDNYFGLSAANMMRVFQNLNAELGGRDEHLSGRQMFSFAIVESCDSQILGVPALRNAFELGRAPFAALYSASGALWFRNLDWDVIFSQLVAGETSSSQLQAALLQKTAEMRNYHVVTPP